MTAPIDATALVRRLRSVTENDAYALPFTFGITCKDAADAIEALAVSAMAAEAALPCNCRSHNRPELGGEVPEIVVTIPEHLSERMGRSEGASSVCLDLCIAPSVLRLWAAGIATLGSCCGHNSQPRQIIVHPEDRRAAETMLPGHAIGAWDGDDLVWTSDTPGSVATRVANTEGGRFVSDAPTPIDTEELRALLDEVTPGPWSVDYPVDASPDFARIMAGDFGFVGDRYMHISGNTEAADARLIALAPTLAEEHLRLVAELREARMQIIASDGQTQMALDDKAEALALLDQMAEVLARAGHIILPKSTSWHKSADDALAAYRKYKEKA